MLNFELSTLPAGSTNPRISRYIGMPLRGIVANEEIGDPRLLICTAEYHVWVCAVKVNLYTNVRLWRSVSIRCVPLSDGSIIYWLRRL